MKENVHSHIQFKDEKAKPFTPSVKEFYEKDVVCLTADDSILDAAKLMLDNHVGDVVIVDDLEGRRVPVGIITDRDIVVASVAKAMDPSMAKISEILKKKIITATEDHGLSELVHLMVAEGISRLPIVDEFGTLRGIISSKRLFQFFAQGLCELTAVSEAQQRREEEMH